MRFKALFKPSAPMPVLRPRAEWRSGLTKTLFVMRLTGFFLLAAMLQVSAAGRAQTVTYSAKSAPLTKVLLAIEQQTGYNVFYDVSDLQDARLVTVDWKATPLRDALTAALAGQPLAFDIQGNTIFVTRKAAEVAIPTAGAFPPGDVHGHITDSLGNPLGGASVTVKGSKKGVSTDAKGDFELKGVDNNATLVVSYTGFESQEIKVNGKSEFVIRLKQGASQLDQTVVKGYYTTTDRLNTGDVTTVTAEDIEKQPVTDPILALEGRVPGLNIQQVSGAPGAYSTIQIRGQNSIANGNDPFYVVDGVPFNSISLSSPDISGGPLAAGNFGSNASGAGISPFNALNPADIESITVLKDADATAIYGSRGANGVILITTKKGNAGGTRFDLNVYTGGGQVTRMIQMMNTQQYMAMYHEAYQNDGLPFPNITTNPSDNNYDIDGFWDTTRYTNWQKVLIGNTANFTNAQGNLSGGTTNTQFVVGGGYSKQGTAFLGNYSDDKASVHLSLTHASSDQRFHLQVGASYVYDNDDLPSADFTGSITLAPDAPVLYDKFGNINWQILNGTATFANPIAPTFTNFKAATNNLISNLVLSYRLLPGLQLKSSFGYNRSEMSQTDIIPSTSINPPYNTLQDQRSNQFATTTFTSWIIEPQLNYLNKVGPGRLEALIGTTFQQRNLSSFAEDAYGFVSDALITDPLAASNLSIYGAESSLYRYDAIYGRLGYNVKDEYLLNVTARRDGSSRFGPGKQFGDFGAVGLGWIFSKERFIQDNLSYLSFGKLRASYGTSGNDQIGDYQYLSTYSSLGNSYQGINGLKPTQLTNPYFAWELDKKLEGGLELGFIKDRLRISASYYRNRTGNQLVGIPLPRVTGFDEVEYNLPAIVQNTGLEMTLNTINIRTKAFSWTSSANLTVPNNKLVAFPNIENFPQYANRYIVGKSLFIQKLYHFTGVDPQTGLYAFATKTGNGNPSYPLDLQTTRPITQKFYGGVDNQFSFKGFTLDIFVQYVNNLGDNYKYSFGAPPGFFDNYNQPTAALNRWRMPGNITNTERFGTTGTVYNPYSTFQQSDGIITGASFLRLKNLALSYQLTTASKDKLHLHSARIYIQCQNLFTITKYLGIDPETGGLNLPPLRMMTAGLQVGI